MDEVLDAAEVVVDSELEGIVVWLLRLVGLFLLVGGAALWLLTDAGLLVLPALLMVIGVALLVAPQLLFAVAELA